MVRKYAWLVAAAAAVVAADQVAKYVVLDRLTTALPEGSKLSTYFGAAPPPGEDGFHYRPAHVFTVHPNFLQLRYAENTGAAFGLFRSVPVGFRAPLFHAICLGAVALIIFYFSRLTGAKSERWARLGLPLVLGGALGNYTDRLSRGFVIDYLEAHWHERVYWPAFNIADTAIVVGVALLLLDAIVRKESKPVAPVAAVS